MPVSFFVRIYTDVLGTSTQIIVSKINPKEYEFKVERNIIGSTAHFLTQVKRRSDPHLQCSKSSPNGKAEV
jgi:hypothetical protein